MLADPDGTNDLTRAIIGCGIKIHRVLGPGLLESTYVPCMKFELDALGFKVQVKRPVPLIYCGIDLGVCYMLDMMVEDQVIVEIKSVEALAPIHKSQLLTYLRMTNRRVGLLMNFNVAKLIDGVKRVINSTTEREQSVG